MTRGWRPTLRLPVMSSPPTGALNELAGLQTCDMDLKHWPERLPRRKRGEGCPQCVDGSVPETEHGVRFFNTDIADGYLQRVGPTPGYSVVVFADATSATRSR